MSKGFFMAIREPHYAALWLRLLLRLIWWKGKAVQNATPVRSLAPPAARR